MAGAAAGGAQRKLAAGARFNFTLVSRACRGSLRALLMPQEPYLEMREIHH
jgi:hypothetical protein